jgi:hypothetical protein
LKTLADARDRDEIAQRLRRVRPEDVPRWGRMTPHQMLCHVADAVLVALGEKGASAATGPAQRTLIKWIALYTPVPWPAGIPTRPELDQLDGGTRPTAFVEDVRRAVALVERFSVTDRGSLRGRIHPIFGALSEAQWLRWGYLHFDHHLRQFGA